MSSNPSSTALSGNSNTTNAGSSNSANANSKSPLLHAWHDPLANIRTNTSCVRLVDLNCDGDSKLCICDHDKKMRVYKGTNLVMEYAILDVPTAMCITYMEVSLPRMPAVAIAAGSHVFIYRQLRPYRRWTCPPIELSSGESDVWSDLQSGSMTTSAAIKRLSELRDNGTTLSSRSSELLSLESEMARSEFIDEVKDVTFVQQTVITCMDTVKKDSEDADALSMLVVGTESCYIYILPVDPTNSNVLCKVLLPSVPTHLSVSGCFDVEWRINVICRDAKMYSIKNGEVRGTALLVGQSVDLGAQAVSIVRQDKSVWIATMDRGVALYSNRGKRLKGMTLNEDVVELCMISLKRAKLNYLLLVALASGEVCIYKDLTNIYSFKVDRPVVAMHWGMYGREENSLVVIHGNGAITIKIWRRLADVDSMNFNAGPPPEQDIPLPVPKKTKLYVEQTQREREKAPEIHRAFQRDLCKLRLTTARAYVKTLTDGLMSSAAIGSHDIRIQVQVLGLGPKFVLRMTFQNSGAQAITQSRLVFSYDVSLYSMGYDKSSQQSIDIPLLLPGPKLIIETGIMSIDAQGRSGQVLCLLYPTNPTTPPTNNITPTPASATFSISPLLTASVKMPPAEPLLF